MKLRILSLGVVATHQWITLLPNLDDPRSISDFDAFVYDPVALQGLQISGTTYLRRQKELDDLIKKKGGVIVCMLRPSQQIAVAGLGGGPMRNSDLNPSHKYLRRILRQPR